MLRYLRLPAEASKECKQSPIRSVLTSSVLRINRLTIGFMTTATLHLRPGLIQSLRASSQPHVSRRASVRHSLSLGPGSFNKHIGPEISLRRRDPRSSLLPVAAAVEEDIGDISFSLEDQGGYGGSGYIISSSEGEDSDIDAFLTPFAETELPSSRERFETPNAALTLSAHRLATIQKGYRKNRTRRGVILTLGLIVFMTLFLLFVDWCSWRIVRLPLEPFFLTCPFSISAFLSACIGFLFVAIVDGLKIHQIIKRERSLSSLKTSIPTIGGLFFLPVGITTWRAVIGHNSILVTGVAAATLGFAAIGLLDDIFQFTMMHKYKLPGWLKLLLHVAVGMWFSVWLDTANLPTPYSMKFLVPLPPPYGLVHLGKCYRLLTLFCFVAMPNAVRLTDGADGLVGGVSALAFVGMSIAVLPISPGYCSENYNSSKRGCQTRLPCSPSAPTTKAIRIKSTLHCRECVRCVELLGYICWICWLSFGLSYRAPFPHLMVALI
ncbi:phospho-N-acetylmuramoyl-pentapeptide-transferase homolog isoform X2 [Phalaenopsis equestris]|uniref:phospho-N-acetylmuramoyl-pentapeptide- transferase homolog isoform X2 n=1 Tax=Phalaenopsis equestris TaxID=78828 RepID=UPI0009E1DC10|nr:phospho-N-acetylmuramoyl-pentapeptide-transferase homolog isoform X2 [Phalaenopsis equestris]